MKNKFLSEIKRSKELMGLKESVNSKSSVTVKPAGHKGNGLFATKDFKKGDLILKSPTVKISDEDWEIIKDTCPVKLYNFVWEDDHRIPLGDFEFDFKNEECKQKWMKTDFWRKYCLDDKLMLSGFLYINDIDKDTEANSKEVFNKDKYIVGQVATKDIKSGDEIIKEYNTEGDWRNN
jgi:SET domain-containing protein